jgi:multiple sugar transport system substrate-binding protein
MKKTNKSALLVMLAAAALFSSCNKNKGGKSAFTPRLSPDTKCRITIAGNYKNFEALEAEFDRFNEFYPAVELSYSYLDNYKGTIKSALSSGAAPDIYMTFPWMLDRPDYRDVLDCAQDLSDEKSAGFNLSTIRSQLISRTSDGRVPLIPVLSGSYGMLVNEDIFKTKGFSVPETYTDLVSACKKLKEEGYKSPVMAYPDTFMGLPLVYAYFCKSIQNSPEAVSALNSLEPSAGIYLRPVLEWINGFMEEGLIDMESCRSLKDKYNAVIMRFFEGNVPVMLCDADVVSGTLKRESQSDAFINKPFKYSFHVFPAIDSGCDFLNSVAVGFSVNKNSRNLDMTDEFMRFLVRTEELNNLAKIKRLITVSNDYSFDEIYAPLSKANPLYLKEFGLTDNTNTQMRTAVYQVMTGAMTVDEAASFYGKF